MFGSRVSRDLSNDIASLGAAVNISSKGIAGTSSHISPLVHKGNVLWSGQLTSVGVPNTVKIVSCNESKKRIIRCHEKRRQTNISFHSFVEILTNWLMSLCLPWRNGRLSRSSAKIHPTLQMSAAEEYSYEPNSNSGGLYQSVILQKKNVLVRIVGWISLFFISNVTVFSQTYACGESKVFGVPYMRANPKSANFIVPSLM